MQINRKIIMVPAVTVSLVLLISGRAIALDTQDSWIEHIKGSVYYAHYPTNFSVYNSIFMVTEEGIILVDPFHVDAAKWLKEELKERFDQPVRYIIYSHFHFDHAPGAEVFSDSVYEIYAQENSIKNINNDTNKNKVKVLPTKTYKGRMELSLGTKRVELLDITWAHTDDTTVVRFPDERIIFAVDVSAPGRVAWRYFGGMTVEDANNLDLMLIDLETIMALDFDIIAPGHGDYKVRKDLRRTYEYAIEMCKRIAMEMDAGSDKSQILETVTMADYSDLIGYDDFGAMNVEGMHYWLTQDESNKQCGTWMER